MADTIRIKGSTTTATPPTLAARELAYSENSGNFFIGRVSDGTPVKIGGKTDVDKLAGIAAGATANASDSQLRDRSTHTGTQLATTISDLAAAISTAYSGYSVGGLTDVDLAGVSEGQVLIYRSGTFLAEGIPGGVSTFAGLTDTPANFTAAGGKIVRVNAGATALEFVEGIDGGTF